MNLDVVIPFFILMISTEGYVKNPYLKAKFVEILSFISTEISDPHEPQNEYHLRPYLESNLFVVKFLTPSLMKFYADVESTGASSQFYDKFNIRYNISQILKSIWSNQGHKETMKRELKQ